MDPGLPEMTGDGSRGFFVYTRLIPCVLGLGRTLWAPAQSCGGDDTGPFY
jgi:hypothetical protein